MQKIMQTICDFMIGAWAPNQLKLATKMPTKFSPGGNEVGHEVGHEVSRKFFVLFSRQKLS